MKSLKEFFGFLKKKAPSWESVNIIRQNIRKQLPGVPYYIAKDLRYVTEKATVEDLQQKYHLTTPELALEFFQNIYKNIQRFHKASKNLKERNSSDALYRDLPGMVVDPNYNLKNTEPEPPAPEEYGAFQSPGGLGKIVAPKRFIPREQALAGLREALWNRNKKLRS